MCVNKRTNVKAVLQNKRMNTRINILEVLEHMCVNKRTKGSSNAPPSVC